MTIFRLKNRELESHLNAISCGDFSHQLQDAAHVDFEIFDDSKSQYITLSFGGHVKTVDLDGKPFEPSRFTATFRRDEIDFFQETNDENLGDC